MSTHDCGSCSIHAELARMGVSLDRVDRVVALAGNPNTGKSTLFNALTGLRQHTGNWPGKTVTRAEGAFEFNSIRYKVVDLPGTYSLLSASSDEEVARDFLLFGLSEASKLGARELALALLEEDPSPFVAEHRTERIELAILGIERLLEQRDRRVELAFLHQSF